MTAHLKNDWPYSLKPSVEVLSGSYFFLDELRSMDNTAVLLAPNCQLGKPLRIMINVSYITVVLILLDGVILHMIKEEAML